ncbi:MAG: hypothetical protein SGPRY_011973 [Prymnesium sp.]
MELGGRRAIDLCVGGDSHHDLSKQEVSEALEREIKRRYYEIVWLATPCSSFSLAQATVEAGATYVIENSVDDRGMRDSPHFTWRTRGHTPLWLMPVIRELPRGGRVTWASFPQCAFRGDYQKWTTLMAAGPRAGWEAPGLGVAVLRAHSTREEGARVRRDNRRRGRGISGVPIIMCATLAFVISADA